MGIWWQNINRLYVTVIQKKLERKGHTVDYIGKSGQKYKINDNITEDTFYEINVNVKGSDQVKK